MSILGICKLLAFFAIGMVCIFAADAFAARWALSGFAKTALAGMLLIPVVLAFSLFDGNARERIRYLLRPVPWIAWVGRIFGSAILVFGFLLALGNVSREFMTFPYAGWLVIFVGTAVLTLNELLLANQTTRSPVRSREE